MPVPFLRSGVTLAAALLFAVVLTGASVATRAPSAGLDGATVQQLDDLTALAPIMLKVEGAPAAAAYADAKDSGASNAEAATTGKAQKAQNEDKQQDVLEALEGIESAEVLYSVGSAYNGIAVQAPLGTVDELAELPGVEAVVRMPLHTPSNASSMRLIGAPGAWQSFGKTGTGIKIGIIDTGVDYVHTNFGGRGTSSDYTTARSAANNPPMAPTEKDTTGFTIVAGDGTQIYPTAKVAGGIDLVGDAYTGSGGGAVPQRDKNPLDCNGHGSHVAGSASGYGVNSDGSTYGGPWNSTTPFDSLRIGPGSAPEATLYAIRVFGCAGSTAVTTQAIDWATDPNGDGNPADRMDVINLSLGSAYGTPIDPSATAANVAAEAGVLPVISSGNSGDAYYDVGSPSTATRAMSVANIADDTDVTDGFQVKEPTSIAGVYGASRGQSYNWANPTSPPATAIVPLEANLYYPVGGTGHNQYGCNPFTGSDATNVSGRIVLVDWKKPGDLSFPCGSAARANNAANAGAVGIIMVDTTPYLDTAIGGNNRIPSMYTVSTVGDTLKSQLTAGVPSGILIRLSHEFSNQTKLTTPGRADTVATSTSRGVRGPDNGLKPDISAPGSGIFSTANGTGNQGVSNSGTSMAAPHMSGVMALLKQLHPTWSVESLKAVAMNTANHDLFTGLGRTGSRYGPGRVGAGRVDVPQALASTSVAMFDGGSGAVGVSFGALEVLGNKLKVERTVRVYNHGSSSQSYSIAFDALTTIPGVTFKFPDGRSLNVPAGSSGTFRIRLEAQAKDMRHTHDPTVAELQSSNGPVFPRQWVSEASGLIKLTPTSGPRLRVPVHAAARPISNMHASQGSVQFSGTATSNTIGLAGTPLNTGPNEPLDLFSRVTALELAAVSGQATLPGTFPAHTRHADLSHVGVASDVKARLAATQPAHNSWIFFGLATHANWATAATEATFTIQIDTNNDNVVDYNVFNTRLVNGANNDPQDIYVGARTRLAPPAPPPAQTLVTDFLNYMALENTALFNSNVMVVPVSAASLGYTATSTSTTFRYRVIGSSRFWGTVDAVPSTTGWLTYNFAAPGLDFSGSQLGSPIYPDQPGSTIPVKYDSAAYAANGSQGVLLLHHLNGTSSRPEVLAVQTTP